MRGSSWVTHKFASPAYVAGFEGNASGAEDDEALRAIGKDARATRRVGPTRAWRSVDVARRVGTNVRAAMGEERPFAASIVHSCAHDRRAV